jgi:large subunit ribosomal protein L13
MNTPSFKTYSAKPKDIERRWYVIDARGEVVGRLATRVATVLRGKHKPMYTPHMDTGDHVIIVNAEHARFTGQKEAQKVYHRYSGYPGGGKGETPERLRTRRPTQIVERAVKGMLPKGTLGRQMFKKLKVYAGPDHPHEAQQPQPLSDVVA